MTFRLQFVDSAPSALGKLEQTPQGGFRAPAKLARVGVMPYSADQMRAQGVNVPEKFGKGSVIYIYTPPEVLSATVDQLQIGDCPVTDGHPKHMIGDGAKYKDVVRGNVLGQSVVFDGKFLEAKLSIQDEDLLGDIEAGRKREVSAGYYSRTRFAQGVTDAGEPYDAVREDILYNHMAVLARGRAGAQVCLALDSDESLTEEEIVKVKIKGVEVDASAAQAAIDALEGELTGLRSDVGRLEGELKAAKETLVVAQSDEALDARIAAKLEAEKVAAEKAKRLQVVKDAYPDLDLEGRGDGFIDGLYEAASRKPADELQSIKQLKGTDGAETPKPKAPKPRLSAREQMLSEQRSMKILP